ncbi:MAG: helix-turn-helix domain-containing protein [Actinobacteria bacterium]|jgi:AraC-like DNA-binding protein|nr:helix-turn-helix domain-containing protein [Actinomycetota bacterium]
MEVAMPVGLLPPPELLRTHNLFRTTSLDEAREQVARVFCPHRLVTTAASGEVRTVHNRVNLGQIGLNYLDYGAEVEIDPGELSSFFLIQIPLAGGSTVTCGGTTVVSTPARASVPNPTESLRMTWHGGSPHLLVHVPRVTAEDRLKRLLGHELIAPLRFDLGMDLTTPRARSWRHLIDIALEDAEAEGLTMQGFVLDQLEDLILTGLLLTHRHNYSDNLAKDVRPAAPRAIREALILFEQSPGCTPTLSELAAAAGVSIRSLQVGFRAHIGMSPTEYLRDLRLQRVRAELQSSLPDQASIADIAYAWGFNHLGRFAQLYRKRFGELPSQTARG